MKNKNIHNFLNLFMRKNKKKLFITFILMLSTSAMNLLIPKITKIIIDEATEFKNLSILMKFILIYGIISLVSIIFEIFLDYLHSRMKNSITIDLKIKILNKLSKFSGQYYSNIQTGNIISILEGDISLIERFGAKLIFSIITNVMTALIAFIFLLKSDPILLIVIISLQIILILVEKKYNKKILNKTLEVRNKSGETSNLVQEYIANIMNIVISKSKQKFFKNYLSNQRLLIKKYISLDVLISGNIAISQILNTLMTMSIYGICGYKIIKGRMTIGQLFEFQQYVGMLIGPCMCIIQSNTIIQQSKVSIDRIYSIINETDYIVANNTGIELNESNINLIEFNNVSFKYTDESTDVLKNIDLKFKCGESTGIVGGSGCGKSTIVNLLYRLWDVNEGQILIDGTDIKDINLNSLRKNISILSQEIFLFNDTIANNIRLNNKKIKDEDIIEICKLVELNDFIDNLDSGINSLVGENGVKISGGQKQRIAIARALISDAKILILDEATSALDNISQNEILTNVSKFLQNKIVIIIAHRLSTIKNADNIYVLSDGNVAEYGKNEDLILNKNIYFNMLNA